MLKTKEQYFKISPYEKWKVSASVTLQKRFSAHDHLTLCHMDDNVVINVVNKNII